MSIFLLIVYLIVSYGIIQYLELALMNVDGTELEPGDKILIALLWLPVALVIGMICTYFKLEDLYNHYRRNKE